MFLKLHFRWRQAGHGRPAKEPVRAVGLDPSVDFVEWTDPVRNKTVRFQPCPNSTFLTVSYDGEEPNGVLELLWFDLKWDVIDKDECSKALVRYYRLDPARFGRPRDESKLGSRGGTSGGEAPARPAHDT